MIEKVLRRLVTRLGYDIVQKRPHEFPVDFDEETRRVVAAVRPYTMTSVERIYATIEAVRYVVRAGVAGAIVECGVWRGGSMMAAAHTLMQLGRRDVDLVMFDTFEGMTRPTGVDLDFGGVPASVRFEQFQEGENSSSWCRASLAEVEENLIATGYPRERMRFVKGKVEDTIPPEAPARISLLRLDTDWYESTRHELLHLYPRLADGGVLIIDDYGHWKGSQKATDEYFSSVRVSRILLSRIDYTGRIGVKR
jgi:O-methyltransferase